MRFSALWFVGNPTAGLRLRSRCVTMNKLVVMAVVQGAALCAATGVRAAAPEILPQDPKRVAEIAALLRPEVGFAETRVGNRAAWGKVVAAEPESAKTLIARGEAVLAQPMTAFDDAECFTVDPKSGDVGVWYTKEMALNGQLQDLVFAECLEGKGRFVQLPKGQTRLID